MYSCDLIEWLTSFLQAHMIIIDIMNPKNTDSSAHIKKRVG